MDILKPLRKCFLCRTQDPPLLWTPGIGCYGEVSDCRGRVYHKQCLIDVLCEPEKYGHKMTDRALYITECIANEEQREKRRLRRAEEACDKAKKICVEML